LIDAWRESNAVIAATCSITNHESTINNESKIKDQKITNR